MDVLVKSGQVDASLFQKVISHHRRNRVFIEKPSSLARQSATWSSYKNHNTFSVLVDISPDGTMVYISHLYEGSTSDVDLV